VVAGRRLGTPGFASLRAACPGLAIRAALDLDAAGGAPAAVVPAAVLDAAEDVRLAVRAAGLPGADRADLGPTRVAGIRSARIGATGRLRFCAASGDAGICAPGVTARAGAESCLDVGGVPHRNAAMGAVPVGAGLLPATTVPAGMGPAMVAEVGRPVRERR
jgi:hypothetical protein